MKLKYFSHSSFQIATDSGHVLPIDPFSDDNRTSPVSSDEISANYIIPARDHGDHIRDSFKDFPRTIVKPNALKGNTCLIL